jgi:hypothetical protein
MLLTAKPRWWPISPRGPGAWPTRPSTCTTGSWVRCSARERRPATRTLESAARQ